MRWGREVEGNKDRCLLAPSRGRHKPVKNGRVLAMAIGVAAHEFHDDPYKNPGLAATLMNAATLMKTAAMGLVGPFFAPAGSEPSLM